MRRALGGVAIVLAFTIGALLASVGGSRAAALRARLPAEDDLLLLPRASALRALSLGHRELAADLVYLRAVIYFGSEVAGQREFRWLANYLRTIVELDPRWKTPYRWAGVATMYNGAAITRERVELSSWFLRQGIERFPDDWELPFMLGCNLLFETKPRDAADKARLTAEAAEWIRRSALVGGAPPWAALLAATILKKQGREDAAVRHLEQVYYATSDERTRQEVRNRLVSLKAKIDFDREASDRAAFEAAWRSELPYVSSNLFVLIGAPRDPRVDWRTLAAARGLLPRDDREP